MQLRLADIAGRADTRNQLTATDFLAALDQNRVAMGIGRDPTISMLDQNEIAVPPQLVAGISDDAAIRGLHGRTAWSGYIDAVIM